MEITMKYDRGVKKEECMTLKVPAQEFETMIQKDYEQRLAMASKDEVVEKRTAVDIIGEMNRREYNSWQTHNKRHRGTTTFTFKDDESEMPVIETIADKTQLEQLQQQADYEALCQKIKQVLKPARAQLLIAVYLDGMSVKDYARKIGAKPDTVSQWLKRSKEVLKKTL